MLPRLRCSAAITAIAQLSQRAQMVTASADLTVLAARGCSLAVLACDGLWDVMGTDEVLAFVSARRARGLALGATAAELVTTAMLLGSKDNISAMLVDLGPSCAVDAGTAAPVARSPVSRSPVSQSPRLPPAVVCTVPPWLDTAIDMLSTESTGVAIELRELRQRLAAVHDRLGRCGRRGGAPDGP